MTFVITEPCIDTMDQSCVDVCPVDCIHFEEGKDRMLYIDPAECIDCGACQPACPVSAIFPEGDVPANQQHFTEINSLWFQDADAARGKVGGGGGAAAPAAEPAAAPAAEAEAEAPAAEAAAEESSAPAAESEPAPAQSQASAPAPAAASPKQTAPPPPARPRKRRSITGFKIGEAGVEGKCALCGQYVIKGGVRFGRKSVLCPDDAKKMDRAQRPYGVPAGRR